MRMVARPTPTDHGGETPMGSPHERCTSAVPTWHTLHGEWGGSRSAGKQPADRLDQLNHRTGMAC